MKLISLLGLACLASPTTQKGPYSLNCPRFSDRMLVVIEFDEGDPGFPWAIKRAKTTPMRTDTDEFIEPDTMTTPRIVMEGRSDPRHEKGKVLENGKRLLVWELQRPKNPWTSIKRLAGSYNITHGGNLHWIEVPQNLKVGQEPVTWENEHLAAAGFELKGGWREVTQLHVNILGEGSDIKGIELLDANDGEMMARAWGETGTGYDAQFDLKGTDSKGHTLIVLMKDGSRLEVSKIPSGSKYRRVRGSKWKKAGLTVETRLTKLDEFYARGKGEFSHYASYRWVNSKGIRLNIFPTGGASGSGNSFMTTLRIPAKLPKGARLEFGVRAGSVTEWLEYEHLDVPAPR